MTLPSLSTYTKSEDTTWERSSVMTFVVLFLRQALVAAKTRMRGVASSADVASSAQLISEIPKRRQKWRLTKFNYSQVLDKRAAIAKRRFCPPDRFGPPLPSFVSNPSSRYAIEVLDERCAAHLLDLRARNVLGFQATARADGFLDAVVDVKPTERTDAVEPSLVPVVRLDMVEDGRESAEGGRRVDGPAAPLRIVDAVEKS